MNINVNIFLDPSSDDDTVLRAISQLITSETPTSLWTRVANDPSYRPFHRAAAVRELFRRHVARPMMLADAARLLDGGRWLLDAEIEQIGVMGGEIPVRIPAGGTAFVIRLPQDARATRPRVGIYLVLDHALDTNLLRDALMSKARDPSIEKIHIVDFALFPESLVATNNQ